MAKELSTKRALISQANTTVVILTSVAAFVLIFCAVATKTLASQAAYQNRVIDKKRAAVNQLKQNADAVDRLKNSYQAFTSTTQNVIGGNTNGTSVQDCKDVKQDGDNAKIVLDALPSSYDFPALTNSIEKLVNCQQLKVTGLTGTDDQVAQSENKESAKPKVVPIPFEITAQGAYPNASALTNAFERSIRPIKIQTLTISGTNEGITLTINAETYYQPAKSLSITSEVVK